MLVGSIEPRLHQVPVDAVQAARPGQLCQVGEGPERGPTKAVGEILELRVGERTREAKVMGVYGSAQTALAATERILAE